MGLHEVNGKRLTPKSVEKSGHIQHAKDSLSPRTFEKICRTIDQAIEDTICKKNSRLVWMNTGSLVGDRASMPHASHQHLWEAVYGLFPSNTNPVAVKNQRITVGALIKWRVAQRPEEWLVHYRETDKTDIVTGETIYASEYWIKPDDVVLSSPRPKPAKRVGTTIAVSDALRRDWW